MSSAGREEPNEALAFAVNYKNFRYSPPFSHCIKTPFEPRAFESGEVPQRRRPVVRCKLRDGPLNAVWRTASSLNSRVNFLRGVYSIEHLLKSVLL